MDSLDYILHLKARKDDHLARQAACEFERTIDRLTAELHAEKVSNQRLQQQSNIFEDKCETLTTENADWQVLCEELMGLAHEHVPLPNEIIAEYDRLSHKAVTVSGTQK